MPDLIIKPPNKERVEKKVSQIKSAISKMSLSKDELIEYLTEEYAKSLVEKIQLIEEFELLKNQK